MESHSFIPDGIIYNAIGHALMITMEHVFEESALHYAAFALGFVGMVMVIIGVFAKRI